MFPGIPRNSLLCPSRLLKLNIKQLHTLLLRLFGSVKVLCDNISATHIAVNPVLHGRSKHLKVDYHFVHERVSHGNMIVRYVPT